jgi:hypothetical protein
MAASDRGFLSQDQGVPPHCPSVRQDRYQLGGHDLSNLGHLGFEVNVNRP